MPSVSVDQLALLWEAAFSFSEFFLKTLSMNLSILWRVIYKCSCPFCAECSAVFDQKWHDPCTQPCHSPDLIPSNFFLFPQMKKSLQREMFCWCGRGKTKNSRSPTRHQNWWVQKLCFPRCRKNILIGVLHQMKSTLFIYLLNFIYLFLFSYSCLHFLPPPSHPSQSHLPSPPLPSPLILSLCLL